jgi:SAM-dependent methyltransferase
MTTADRSSAESRVALERREADRRYNDALTALDRAIVALGERDEIGRGDLLPLASTLIVFLQQITAFVDTKDREIAASIDARVERIARGLEPLSEIRAQIAVLQRSIQSLTRAGGQPASTERPAASNLTYVAFEDLFRGSDAATAEKLRRYVPIFAGARDVVDLGCGRGELLGALKGAGIAARGVDANAEMAAIARERGLDAVHGDALAFLESVADGSLGGLVSTQVIEHLQPDYLMRLIEVAALKLRAGAPIVLETINPACWLAFFSSYIRDLTHVRPVHPETLQFLLRANGFERVEIRYSAPVPDEMKLRAIDLPSVVLGGADPLSSALASIAHTVNANAAVVNALLFTYLDYAAIGYRAEA